MSTVTVVDYGVGNVASIANMLKKAGHSAILTDDHRLIRNAEKIILPGVGAFDYAAAKLEETGMRDLLRERASAGVPVLGVCLGMQLLLDSSDEGELAGLGLISGSSHRFPTEVDGERLRVPHMGWNVIARTSEAPQALPSIVDGDRFYFVHSFYVKPNDPAHVIATTRHGVQFASMICRENVVGVQFHPEKSHRYGLRLLSDFAEAA